MLLWGLNKITHGAWQVKNIWSLSAHMITNRIVSTVFLRSTCYRFSPVWEAAHSSVEASRNEGPGGPWEASTGRGRFLDALPRLDFSAVASLPPRRQWIPWGPGTFFFQPQNILTLQMAMESGCLCQSAVARGAVRAQCYFGCHRHPFLPPLRLALPQLAFEEGPGSIGSSGERQPDSELKFFR